MKKSTFILLIVTLFFPFKGFTQESDGSESIMIVGIDNPGPNSRLHYLPGVKAECESIAAITQGLKQIIFIGEDANPENIYSGLKTSPNILHLSGHGFTINNNDDLIMPLYSEEPLFLGGERNNINKNAIFDISKLKEYNIQGIDLVVLSTNHSYMPSVIEALKEANVKSCLLTGWAVDDEATQILMTNFYKNYVGGMTKQQALREAQKTARETPGFSDPEFWAAFILLDALN